MAKKSAAKAAPSTAIATFPAIFNTLDSSVDGEDKVMEDGPAGAPYVTFYTQRSSVDFAMKVKEALGGVEDGHPVLVDGEEVYSLAKADTILMGEFACYADVDYDDGGKVLAVSFTKQDDLKETFLAYTAHVFEDGVRLAVSRMQGSHCAWIRDLVRGVKHAETPSFLEVVSNKLPQLGKAMQSLPPRFRVAGRVSGSMRKGRGKYSYVATKCRPAALSVETFQRFGEALNTEDFKNKVGEMLAIMEERKAELQQKA